MSLNRMPGFGKSGMSRIRPASSLVVAPTAGSLEQSRVYHVLAAEESIDAAAIVADDDHGNGGGCLARGGGLREGAGGKRREGGRGAAPAGAEIHEGWHDVDPPLSAGPRKQ